MTATPATSQSYRWVIVLAGMCGLFASLGIGRFALGMLLPSMGEALGLSYGEMGVIGTLNFCGYLLAVLLCGLFSTLLGARLLISLALLVVGSSMLLIGLVEQLYLIMALYCLTGVGSALSNVPIMALIAAWFPPSYRGRAAGLVVVGNGAGIIMAGHLVPVLNRSNSGWQSGWLVLGAIAVLAAAVCWLLIRNAPDQAGKTGERPALRKVLKEKAVEIFPTRDFKPIFLHCAGIYFLFGFTYVIYMTFFVTSLVQERGFSEAEAGLVWSWVGILSLGSGPMFGYLSDRFGRKAGLITVFCIQAMAYTLAGSYLPEFCIYLSIVCYGIVAWSIPSIMAALVGDVAGPQRSAAIFGFVTFVFGFGQVAGPFCAGLLAQYSGGFAGSFVLAAVLALAAALLSGTVPGGVKAGEKSG